MKTKLLSVITLLSANFMLFGQVVVPNMTSNGRVFYLPLNSTAQGADLSENYSFEVFNASYGTGLTGAANEAFVSNGSNSSIIRTFSQNDLQSMNGVFTVGMWVRVDQFPNLYSNLFEIGQNHFLRIAAPSGLNTVNIEYGFLDENGAYQLFGHANSPVPMQLNRATFQNKWMHVAVTSDVNVSLGLREVKVFINGELLNGFQFFGEFMPHFTQNENFTIGSRFNSTTITLSGMIQDFVWFNRVLSSSELRGLGCYANANITENSGALEVNTGMYTYQWLDCDNSNAPITNATSNSFNVAQSGSYSVIVTRNTACQATANCFVVNLSGGGNVSILENHEDALSVFPNPAHDLINLSGIKFGSRIELFNNQGLKVYEVPFTSENVTINTNNLSNGLYILNITNSNGESQQHKVVLTH
jgi:hypothetical protein